MNHKLLKARRKQLGYTVREVSKRTGLANGTITAFERPGYDPKLSTFTLIAKCYRLDRAALLNNKLKPSEFHLAEVNGAG